MKTNKSKITLLIVIVFLAALACSAPFRAAEDSNDSNVPDTTSNSGTESGVLFQDDFSSDNSGWSDLYRDATGMTDYDQGGFRIQVNETNFDYWANPNLYFTDTVIEVDATKIGGPEDNDFGVICRYSGVEDFYFFLLTSDGYFGIGKYVDGVQELIGSDSLVETDTVFPGNATNKIRAECEGNTLRLFANGTLLSEVTDSEHIGGDVGLIAGTFDDPGTDILFDNFIVTAP